MYRPWFRSRLFWIGIFVSIFLAWAWSAPILRGKANYFSVRWVTLGRSYRGFGVTRHSRRVELWMGRPNHGWLGIRPTGIITYSVPFDLDRDSWESNAPGPFWLGVNPGRDRLTFSADYWLVMLTYLIAWYFAVVCCRRRKRRFAQ